jgi:DNA-directed RNA polymerase beta subunit
MQERGFIRYQIDSYNHFIKVRLQRVIDEIGEIRPEIEGISEFKIKFGKIRVGEPSVCEADGSLRKIMPMEARIRDMTYAAPLFLQMKMVIDGEEGDFEEVKIGEFPVMIKSDICHLSKLDREGLIKAGEDPDDPGGYFIINGTERVLVLVEEITPNKIIFESKKRGTVVQSARITSERSGWGQRHVISRKKDGLLEISFANLRGLSLVVLLRALGLETDKDIIYAISEKSRYQSEIYANLYNTDVTTTKEALEFIGKTMRVFQPEYRASRAEQIIDKYLLPHLGQDKSARFIKAKFLAMVAKRLLQLARGEIEQDDIDHYSNKRLQLAGDLLEMIFRSILLGRWGLIARINYNYQKITKRGKMPSISAAVESNLLTNHINSSLATGIWVGGRTGVAQRLERTNWVRTIAHLRNVISPLSTTQEHFEARELHPTYWGRLCPAETPEGPTIGLRKYLAILSEITTETDPFVVKNAITKIRAKVSK